MSLKTPCCAGSSLSLFNLVYCLDWEDLIVNLMFLKINGI
jgi:hypothetical protein